MVGGYGYVKAMWEWSKLSWGTQLNANSLKT
ncbi:MAG: hypothetical protein RL497_910 [Pseudomonadota bacterium]|jgi:hypothetical protein